MSLLLFCAVSAIVQAATDNKNVGIAFEGREVHCTLGAIGLLLVLSTLAAGFLVSGRFGRIKGLKPLPIHKTVVIIMAVYLTTVFIYGQTLQNVLFINSRHGILGFLVIALAWITAGINPLMLKRAVNWKIATKIHLILAASLLTVIVIHLLYAVSVFGE